VLYTPIKTIDMKANKIWGSSSFHGVTIVTTARDLMKLASNLEAPYHEGNDGQDKTNFDFSFETSDEEYFTVYDWKEYRVLNVYEPIEFHIGAETEAVSRSAREELINELNKVKR